MTNIKAWAKHLWTNFRLTVEQWLKIFEFQHEVCCICGRPNRDGKRLSVDHDHKTGLIRGLLCQQCNRVLGKIEDPRWEMTPIKLRRLADYWEHPSATAALGKEVYGYKGRVGTKAHRKRIKKAMKAGLLKLRRKLMP